MGMKELRDCESDQAWDKFLERKYNEVKEDHSASYWSWTKTRFRSGHKRETAVNTAGQAGNVVGLAGAGVGVAVAAGVAMSAAAAAATAGVTGIGVPLIVTALALYYFRKTKKEHHKVNDEIRSYFYENQNAQDHLKLDASARPPTAQEIAEWLGWFGDEGIDNMKYLSDKLGEAQGKFTNNYNALISERAKLSTRMVAWKGMKPKTPQEEQQRQNDELRLGREADVLADKYLALAKDLQYVKYRLERLFMYYEMLDLTVRKVHEDVAKPGGLLETARIGAEGFLKQNLDNYEKLWCDFDDLPLPAAQPAGPARVPPPVPAPRPARPVPLPPLLRSGGR